MFYENVNDISTIREKLEKTFVLKTLGDPKQFLNMELNWTDDAVTTRQRNFVRHLLDDAGMLTWKLEPSLMSLCHELNEKTVPRSKEDAGLYQSLVGSFYLDIKSTPDICLVASMLESYFTDQTKA